MVYVSTQAGETARAAIAFCEEMGGRVPERHLVKRVACIGSEGRHKSNSERDLQRIMKQLSLEVKIECIPVRTYAPQQGVVVEKNMPIIFPDSMATALWKRGEKVFRHYFFGQVNARKFWKHCMDHCAWFKQHPAAQYNKKSCLIPLSLYGDEVQSYKNSECGVVEVFGWCSDFADGQSPLSRYLPIFCFSEHLLADETWPDIWRGLLPRLHRMVTENNFPWSAAGYKFMLSSLQGDLKWLLQRFGVFNYMRNEFCSLCGCCKAHADNSMTVGDMRENASHVSTVRTHEEFMASGSVESRILAKCYGKNML